MTTPTPRDIELAKDALTGVLIAQGTACESIHAPILSAIAIARAEGEAAGAAKEREACAKQLDEMSDAAKNSAEKCERNRNHIGNRNDVLSAYLLRTAAKVVRGAPTREQVEQVMNKPIGISMQGAPDAKPE